MTSQRSPTPAARTASRTGASFPRPVRWTTWAPSGSAPAATVICSLMWSAPSDPPVTRSVWAPGSMPRREAASSRERLAASSSRRRCAREAMAARSGRPVVTVRPRFALSGDESKVRATTRARRAPTLFAIPGLAFCSWTTTGTPVLCAAE